MFYASFQSTPSGGRATRGGRYHAVATIISIHALREEGDGLQWSGPGCGGDFNPRPP